MSTSTRGDTRTQLCNRAPQSSDEQVHRSTFNSSEGFPTHKYLSTHFARTFAFETPPPSFGKAKQHPASDPTRVGARRGRGRAARGPAARRLASPEHKPGKGRVAAPEPRGGRADGQNDKLHSPEFFSLAGRRACGPRPGRVGRKMTYFQRLFL